MRKPKPKPLPPGPVVETRGRNTIAPNGVTRSEKVVTLLTAEEKQEFLAEAKAKNLKPQALSRRALHGVCPAISIT